MDVDVDTFARVRELLADQRREGEPWDPELWALTVAQACDETGGKKWMWTLIDTTPAWRDAYDDDDQPDAAIESWGPALLDDPADLH